MGTELAINGKLGEKLLGMVIIHMLELHLKLIKNCKCWSLRILIHVHGPEEYGGGGDAAATADQDSACETKESYQIQVGPGDAIPGLSPHIGRMGIGFTPIDDLGVFVDAEYNSRQFYRGDENNDGQKVPGYFF